MQATLKTNEMEVTITNATPSKLRAFILNGSHAAKQPTNAKPSINDPRERVERYNKAVRKPATGNKSIDWHCYLPNKAEAWVKELPKTKIASWKERCQISVNRGFVVRHKTSKNGRTEPFFYLEIQHKKTRFWSRLPSLDAAWSLRDQIFKMSGL